jgi:hypothetical protein
VPVVLGRGAVTEDCRVCSADGVVTQLVRVGPWGICPVHEREFLASLDPIPAGAVLVQKPVLRYVGVPHRMPAV